MKRFSPVIPAKTRQFSSFPEISGTVVHDPMGHPEMMKMPLFKAASHFLL
jgi:hypothetical protein